MDNYFLLQRLPSLETSATTRPMKEPTPLLSPSPPPTCEPDLGESQPPRTEAAPQQPAAFNLNGLLSNLPAEMQRGAYKCHSNGVLNLELCASPDLSVVRDLDL